MKQGGFLTLAIHTYDHALALKSVLEEHGIVVKFDNIGISGTKISSGVRVKIRECDLTLALKIIESGDLNSQLIERRLTGVSEKLLIPVDFSEMSFLAIKAAFELAVRLNLSPVLLHAFATPYFGGSFPYTDDINSNQQLEDEAIEARDIRLDAEVTMRKLKSDLKDMQAVGDLPKIDFSTRIEEGVAEEVILNFTRKYLPQLVVMATRGRHKREKELVGSVTAEVLDSCRVPLVTIPENYSFCGIEHIVNLALFCNLDQHDLQTVDSLMRMFGYPDVNIWIVPVNDRAGSDIDAKTKALCDYFSSNYKTAKFYPAVIKASSFRTEFENLVQSRKLQMLIVPNKKKNIFSRLFNPGIAHKLLFERDMTMFVLPV